MKLNKEVNCCITYVRMTEVFQHGHAVDGAFSFDDAIKRSWFTLRLLEACLALQRICRVRLLGALGICQMGQRGVQANSK